MPNRMPTPAVISPARTNTITMLSSGKPVVSLKAANAPQAMKPPVPSDSWPA